jgi:hypothetical protein
VDTGFPQKMRPAKEAGARFRFNLIETRSKREMQTDAGFDQDLIPIWIDILTNSAKPVAPVFAMTKAR